MLHLVVVQQPRFEIDASLIATRTTKTTTMTTLVGDDVVWLSGRQTRVSSLRLMGVKMGWKQGEMAGGRGGRVEGYRSLFQSSVKGRAWCVLMRHVDGLLNA